MAKPKPPEPMAILVVKVPKSTKDALFRRGNVSARVRELLAAATYPDRMATPKLKQPEPEPELVV